MDPTAAETRLVTQLPLEALARRPALCLNRAWMQLISGNIDILPLIEMAERQPGHQLPRSNQFQLLHRLELLSDPALQFCERMRAAFVRQARDEPRMRNAGPVGRREKIQDVERNRRDTRRDGGALGSRAPHFPQKIIPAGLSKLQASHCMVAPLL